MIKEQSVNGPTVGNDVPLMLGPLNNYHYNGFCGILYIKGYWASKARINGHHNLLENEPVLKLETFDEK